MEAQLTDFENAAFVVFIVLLTRVILTYKLDFLMPISYVSRIERLRRLRRFSAFLCRRTWFLLVSRNESLFILSCFIITL